MMCFEDLRLSGRQNIILEYTSHTFSQYLQCLDGTMVDLDVLGCTSRHTASPEHVGLREIQMVLGVRLQGAMRA